MCPASFRGDPHKPRYLKILYSAVPSKLAGAAFFTVPSNQGGHAMLDLMLKIASGVLQMNLRDHHDIPFALPLVFAAVLGFVIGFIILKFIGEEQKQDAE